MLPHERVEVMAKLESFTLLQRLNFSSNAYRSVMGREDQIDISALYCLVGAYVSSLHAIVEEQQKQIDRLTERVLCGAKQ